MRLALIGVGLIGGSFARALRVAGAVDHVAGFDVDSAVLQRAAELGVIDEAAASSSQAIDQADIVLIATPVGSVQQVLRGIAPHLAGNVVVTDVGSTKSSVVDAARIELGAAFERFVPGHPIAGSERSGVANSRGDLFHDSLFVSTPTEQTNPAAVKQIEQLWRAVGCRTQRMSPEEHDKVFAAVSHLPHVLAFALMAYVSAQPDAAQKFALAGTGFRDLTRIAGSSPQMWADICGANRQALAAELAGYRALLDRWQYVIETRDTASMRSFFETAGSARRTLDERKQ